MRRKIRVLIVDDSTVIRRLLTDVLSQDPDIEVVGTAANGSIALAKIGTLKPDVVTLDIEMPEKDGLETIKEIRLTDKSLPVIMFSTLTHAGAEATLDAISFGASDYATKPSNTGGVTQSKEAITQNLVPKIKGLCKWFSETQFTPVRSSENVVSLNSPKLSLASQRSSSRPEIVVVGVSTGGPTALAAILPEISANFPLPILVVQHMPPIFTQHLATRLDQQCRLTVKEAVDLDEVKPGVVYIAPGDRHMVARRRHGRVFVELNSEAPENSCRPAVDVLFRSAASTYGRSVLGVILTGMGKDGLRGSQAVKAAGGSIIAQDQATSVVWGMPRAIVEHDLADDIVSLQKMAHRVEHVCVRGA